MDRRVLLRLKAIDALQRKESAQALYTYIESLPQNARPYVPENVCGTG